MKIIKNIVTTYQKIPLSGKILLFTSLFLILTVFFRAVEQEKQRRESGKEGFEQTNSFLFQNNSQVYDDFHSNIYDYLVFDSLKDDYEVGEIINRTSPTSESVILDIGCGTGHHVAKLAGNGLNVIGIDISPSMIQKAKENYPHYHFLVGDVLNNNEFKGQSFTHILCLYFTLYYIEDKRRFFNHCYDWLKHGGYLIVHLVDQENVNTILPRSTGLSVVSPQKYTKEKKNQSKLYFKDFVYQSEFDLPKGAKVAKIKENFKFKDGKVRKQEHTLYMEDQNRIINYAQESGFIIQGKIDLVHCNYDYQYLYILTKP